MKIENLTKNDEIEEESNSGVEESRHIDAKQIEKDAEDMINKLMPYKKSIIMGLWIVLITLVVFLGFAFGGLTVCSQVDGFLSEGFKCHLNYTSNPQTFHSDNFPPLNETYNLSVGAG